MSHTVVGIDLGSHAVKFSLVEAGFRQAQTRGVFAELVASGEAPLAERQLEALRRGLERLPPQASLQVSMPGEQLTLRVLDLPFSDPRKIDQVVGYELEGQIVHALSDIVYDHQLLRSASPDEGTSVLVVAARMDDVGALLSSLAAEGVDPRALYAAPLIYETLMGDEPPPVEEGGGPPLRVVLDIGHTRTNVCVLRGTQAVSGRTILRGGASITAAIAADFNCDEPTAEEIKHQRTRIGANSTAEAVRLDGIVTEALTPLLRDIRLTLASVRARVKEPIQNVLLTGGTAALAGLDDYLAAELELPVSVWDGAMGVRLVEAAALGAVEADEAGTIGPEEPDSRFALASAAAWAGVRGDRRLDLRKGPFVYKASLSILRQKAVHLSALAAAVVIAITINAITTVNRLRSEQEQVEKQLRTQTTELFGQPNMVARSVTDQLRRSFKDEMAPIPKATAYDLLGEISRKVPSNETVKLDILELDIRPKKVFIKGTVGSAAAVDELQNKLKAIDCFEEINKGSITEVSGGAKNFSLTIATKC
ncbi:MAG TPA: type II secretion system protein GspL [Polyangia bacterium]